MTILDILEQDHRRFEAVLEGLDACVLRSGDVFRAGWSREAAASSARILGDLLPAIREHQALERDWLHPELERRVPEGGAYLETARRADQALDSQVSDFLEAVSGPGEKPPAWMILHLLRLINEVARHMRREEEGVFELARRHIPAGRLETVALEAARSRSPGP